MTNRLADLLASVNAIPPGDPPGIAADWLMERDCTLPKVLLLFAGEAPQYTDGLRQEALAAWLRETESTRQTGIVGQVFPVYRWQAVQAVSIEGYRVERNVGALPHRLRTESCCGIEAIAADVWNHSEPLWEWRNLCRRCETGWATSPSGDGVLAFAVARARRWLKRTVLAFFPEVLGVEREFRVSLRMDKADIAYGIRRAQEEMDRWPTHVPVDTFTDYTARHLVFRQRVMAPALIPPESAQYGPSPLHAAYPAWWTAQQIEEARRNRP